jgi:hypothetical protein
LLVQQKRVSAAPALALHLALAQEFKVKEKVYKIKVPRLSRATQNEG